MIKIIAIITVSVSRLQMHYDTFNCSEIHDKKTIKVRKSRKNTNEVVKKYGNIHYVNCNLK